MVYYTQIATLEIFWFFFIEEKESQKKYRNFYFIQKVIPLHGYE